MEIETDAVDGDEARRDRRVLARTLGAVLLLYAASRIVAVAAIALGTKFVPDGNLRDAFDSWDVGWWQRLIDHGYPNELPQVEGRATASTIAFFPLFPLVVRAVLLVTPFSTFQAAIVVAVGGGAVATVLLWFLADRLAGPAVAMRTVALFCFFPASFALLLPLSEGVMLVTAFACLLALVSRHWVTAGAFALLAGASRPTGLVLGLACGVAAIVAVARRREWRSLAAPLLAPWGTIGYFAFLWARTGEHDAWFRVEDEGWEHGASDFGWTAVVALGRFLRDPTYDMNVAASSLALLFTILGVVLMFRWRPPAPLWAYTAGMIALSFFPVLLASRPRYTLANVPLLIALARETESPALFATAVGVSATLMGGLALVTTSSLMATF